MDRPDEARASYTAALKLFRKLGAAGLAGVADQQGNLGLFGS